MITNSEQLWNSFRWTLDSEQYGVTDVWKDYSQLVLQGQEKFYGDCEDYAITAGKLFNYTVMMGYYKNSGHSIAKVADGVYVDSIQKKPFNITEHSEYHDYQEVSWDYIDYRLDKDANVVPLPDFNHTEVNYENVALVGGVILFSLIIL